MVIRDSGVMESESDRSDCEDMSSLKDFTDGEVAYSIEGKALVIRRTLQVQVKEDDIDQKKKTSFIHVVMYKTSCVV